MVKTLLILLIIYMVYIYCSIGSDAKHEVVKRTTDIPVVITQIAHNITTGIQEATAKN
jgi:hypothetical protein